MKVFYGSSFLRILNTKYVFKTAPVQAHTGIMTGEKHLDKPLFSR
jgi:hypothetical protein